MLTFGKYSLRLATILQGKHESLSLQNISSSGFIHYDGKAILQLFLNHLLFSYR